MEKFLYWLQGAMDTPTLYGWFHLMWFAILIIECVLIYLFRKKISRKAVNIILLICGILLIIFEIYKQLVFSFQYDPITQKATWDYQWYAFPFQFCSTPMYLMILAGILRKGKVYDCLTSYLATFAFFGGIIVMFYPAGVFVGMIGINIQTMFWHSSMVMIAFLLMATKTIEFRFKTIFKAFFVFLVMLSLAMIMNILWHYYGTEETFNMFYISPYYPCPLAVLGDIYQKTNYFLFLLIYSIGFTLAAFIILCFAILLKKLENYIQYRKSNNQNKTDAEN